MSIKDVTNLTTLKRLYQIYSGSATYSAGDKVSINDSSGVDSYVSRVDSNTGNNPRSNPSKWSQTSTPRVEFAARNLFIGPPKVGEAVLSTGDGSPAIPCRPEPLPKSLMATASVSTFDYFPSSRIGEGPQAFPKGAADIVYCTDAPLDRTESQSNRSDPYYIPNHGIGLIHKNQFLFLKDFSTSSAVTETPLWRMDSQPFVIYGRWARGSLTLLNPLGYGIQYNDGTGWTAYTGPISVTETTTFQLQLTGTATTAPIYKLLIDFTASAPSSRRYCFPVPEEGTGNDQTANVSVGVPDNDGYSMRWDLRSDPTPVDATHAASVGTRYTGQTFVPDPRYDGTSPDIYLRTVGYRWGFMKTDIAYRRFYVYVGRILFAWDGGAETLTLSVPSLPSNAVIKYKLNGGAETTYTGPISLSSTSSVTACAGSSVADGQPYRLFCDHSKAVTITYTNDNPPASFDQMVWTTHSNIGEKIPEAVDIGAPIYGGVGKTHYVTSLAEWQTVLGTTYNHTPLAQPGDVVLVAAGTYTLPTGTYDYYDADVEETVQFTHSFLIPWGVEVKGGYQNNFTDRGGVSILTGSSWANPDYPDTGTLTQDTLVTGQVDISDPYKYDDYDNSVLEGFTMNPVEWIEEYTDGSSESSGYHNLVTWDIKCYDCVVSVSSSGHSIIDTGQLFLDSTFVRSTLNITATSTTPSFVDNNLSPTSFAYVEDAGIWIRSAINIDATSSPGGQRPSSGDGGDSECSVSLGTYLDCVLDVSSVAGDGGDGIPRVETGYTYGSDGGDSSASVFFGGEVKNCTGTIRSESSDGGQAFNDIDYVPPPAETLYFHDPGDSISYITGADYIDYSTLTITSIGGNAGSGSRNASSESHIGISNGAYNDVTVSSSTGASSIGGSSGIYGSCTGSIASTLGFRNKQHLSTSSAGGSTDINEGLWGLGAVVSFATSIPQSNDVLPPALPLDLSDLVISENPVSGGGNPYRVDALSGMSGIGIRDSYPGWFSGDGAGVPGNEGPDGPGVPLVGYETPGGTAAQYDPYWQLMP